MNSARFGLPLLAPGQAQKELGHNEAIQGMELYIQPVVQSVGENEPPDAVAIGQAFVIGAAPSGAWAGHAAQLALLTEGGWRFARPFEGMRAHLEPSGQPIRFSGGAWTEGVLDAKQLCVEGRQVVGRRAAAIADPAGGATADIESRGAVKSILAALRQHGLIEG